MECTASNSRVSKELVWECSFLKTGRVCGTDTEGVRYDGEYLFDERAGLADVKMKITFPPNVRAVFGVSNPYEWSFDITNRLDPKRLSGQLAVKTSMGQTIGG